MASKVRGLRTWHTRARATTSPGSRWFPHVCREEAGGRQPGTLVNRQPPAGSAPMGLIPATLPIMKRRRGVRRTHRWCPWVLAALPLLAACASAGRGGPSYYEQSADSATSSCLRNPACYNVPAGEEAVLPWVSRGIDAARTAHAALKLLEAAEVARVEQVLIDCAEQAERTVNERHFGQGGSPDEHACREVVGRDAKGRPVTRAAQLGDEKHQEAFKCVAEKLGTLFPGNFSIESTYVRDSVTGPWRWIDPAQVQKWLDEGLSALLIGALVPDFVLHATGDPLKVQFIYDFKFLCPNTGGKKPRWNKYPPDSPHYPKNQGEVYGAQLGGQEAPAMVSPGHGVFRDR